MNPSGDKQGFNPARRLVFLLAPAAGAAFGVLFVEALTFEELARRFWPTARLDPQALSSTQRGLIVLAGVVLAVGVWLGLAATLRGARSFSESLARTGLAFLPTTSILALYVTDVYGIMPGAMVFSVHALVMSVAGFLGIVVILATAEESAPLIKTKGWIDRHAGALVTAAALLYVVVFFGLGCLQYDALNISHTDTGDWEQMIWNTMRGRFLVTSDFDHMFFGEHVQFVHLLLLPFYALAGGLKTLMFFKSAALASGAIPVYLVARGRLSSRSAGVAFAAAYLLYPGMQYVDLEMVYNTFRPVAFAIPALLWAVWCLEREHKGWFVIVALVALAAKEEMALPVAMLGVLYFLKGARWWGAGVVGFAAAWFAASVFWVIPHFRGAPSHMVRYYSDFGENLTFPGLIAAILIRPLHTLKVALAPVKIDYLLLLLVPLGLRTLFSWRMALVMLPSLATTLLASRDPSYRIHFHYQAALVPFMVMGAVYGTGANVRMLGGCSFFLKGHSDSVRRRAAVGGLSVLVLTAAVCGNVLFAQSPISLLFHNPGMETYWRNRYVPDERSRYFFEKVRPLVPADASVSATEFVATTFAARRDVYVFPVRVGEVEFIVVDTNDRWLADRLAGRGTTLEAILTGSGYENIHDAEGFLLYRLSAAGALAP